MKPILSTSNIETFYQLYWKEVNNHILQFFFKQIWIIQKKNWKDIRKLISLKITSNSVPSTVIENNITLTKPKYIANTFQDTLKAYH